jgi:hypothetical protein
VREACVEMGYARDFCVTTKRAMRRPRGTFFFG